LLQEGASLCIFPEGDLSRDTDREAAAGKTGAAFLALNSRAPVYPAHIDGGPRSRRLLRDWLWPSHGARVVFGPPIDLSAYYGRPVTHQLLREVTAVIMRRLGELAPVHKTEDRGRETECLAASRRRARERSPAARG